MQSRRLRLVRQENLLSRFDHTNLNTLDCFREKVSTTENLSLEIYNIFKVFPHAHLERVHIEETPNNSFDYTGAVANRHLF